MGCKNSKDIGQPKTVSNNPKDKGATGGVPTTQ
jgi:hypothetical protein